MPAEKLTIGQILKLSVTEKSALQTNLDVALAEVGTLTVAQADLNAQITTLTEERDELQRCNSTAATDLDSMTALRDTALSEVTRLETEATAAAEQAAEIVANLGLPAAELPPQNAVPAKSEKEMIAAIDAEKDPVKKHKLYTEYAAEFLDK